MRRKLLVLLALAGASTPSLLGGWHLSAKGASHLFTGPQVRERSTPLLLVDFLAVSRDGTTVEGLTADDITVRIGGRVRAVRSLQLISVADPGSPGANEAIDVPPPFGTNATSDRGRTLVLAVDDDSFRPGRETPLREAVGLLVKELMPRDRLALVTMPYGGLKVALTTDHTRVQRALTQVVGNAPPAETGSQLACRSRDTLLALSSFLRTLGIREEPTTVMFITSALAPPRRDAPMTMAPGMCELQSEVFTEVGVAAGAARANFYLIQPGDALERNLTVQHENIAGAGFLGSDNPIAGIEHLAGATGGKMLQLTRSTETAFGRILRESSAHYLIAIDPDRNDRTGRSQQLEVRLKRPGAEVRARPHITFPKPEPALGRAVEPSPRDMLAAPTLFRDLPLRATAFVSPGADESSVRVMTFAEPVDPTVKFAHLMAALFNPDGKAVAHWVATKEELERTPVIGAILAPQGAYRLRVAAIDTTGVGGSTEYEFTTDLPSTGPLKLSSIVLGLSRDGSFLPKLQFTDEPVVIGYVELYGGAAGMGVNATMELARTVNSPAIVAVPLVIESGGENRYVAKGAVPIGKLPPGDYVVRALVALEGQPMTRVVRTLRKVAAVK